MSPAISNSWHHFYSLTRLFNTSTVNKEHCHTNGGANKKDSQYANSPTLRRYNVIHLVSFLRLITRWHRFHRSMPVLLKTDTRYEWSIIRNEDSRCKIFPRFSVFSAFLQFYILIFYVYFQDSTWLLSSLAKSTKLLLLSTSVRLFNARYNQSYTNPKNFSLRRWSIKTRQITIDTFNIKYRNYEEIDGRI